MGANRARRRLILGPGRSESSLLQLFRKGKFALTLCGKSHRIQPRLRLKGRVMAEGRGGICADIGMGFVCTTQRR